MTGKPNVNPRAVIRSYRTDRATTRGLLSWPVFMRVWLRSWVIAFKATDPSEVKMQAFLWAERHPDLRKKG